MALETEFQERFAEDTVCHLREVEAHFSVKIKRIAIDAPSDASRHSSFSFLVVESREWHRGIPGSGVRLSISTVVINQVAAKGQHLSPIPGACALRHQQSQNAV